MRPLPGLLTVPATGTPERSTRNTERNLSSRQAGEGNWVESLALEKEGNPASSKKGEEANRVLSFTIAFKFGKSGEQG